MSRKSKRNEARRQPGAQAPQPPRPDRRKAIFAASVIGLLAAFVVGVLMYHTQADQSGREAAAKNLARLESPSSPTLGPRGAKVHIVEFLDPACETCAAFYPRVKKIMAENPERIRLTIRHVPFHAGSDEVVRILEAARKQDRYWPTLEALLAAQSQWVINHRAHADRVWPLLAASGLNLDVLRGEMHSADIARRIDKDHDDARTLGVTRTPEFFVNGRPMPRFGLEELQTLVREELKEQYAAR